MARRTLERVKALTFEVDALEDSLLEVDSRLKRITPVYSDMPKAQDSSTDKMIDGIIRLIDLKREYESKINKLVLIIQQCNMKIEKIKNPLYRTILRELYLNNSSIKQISLNYRYSYNHVCKLHKQALIEFCKNDCSE